MSTAEEFYALAPAKKDDAKPKPWEGRVTIVPTEWYETPAPARRWLLRDARHHDEGVFPLGKVGLLVAEGGAGKTMAIVQLSIAVATGTTWLDTFRVPQAGKVLLLLGEEDAEEVHRRIHRATFAAPDAPRPPEGSIVTLPLTGIACPMVENGDDGAFLVWLREHVKETGPYSLIVVDPLSRFSGVDAERDNAAGTRFCQALESLVEPSGGASILGSHHVNKQSRGSGAHVDASSARGSSAITDGVRWVSTLSVEHIPDAAVETMLTFGVAKTNYAKRPPPLSLRYSDGGVLVPLGESERETAERVRDESTPQARRQRKAKEVKATRNVEIDAVVLSCVKAHPGIGSTDLRAHVKAKAECGGDAADTAIARMIDGGRVRRIEGKTKQHFIVEETKSDPPESSVTMRNGWNGANASPYATMSIEDV